MLQPLLRNLIRKGHLWLIEQDLIEPPDSLVFKSRLFGVHIPRFGRPRDLGLLSCKVVTTVGVNALVDAFQGLFTLSNFKYHISGTEATAEGTGDTEATITGSTPAPVLDATPGEGASANIYKTVGIIAYTSTLGITSHGLINSATKAGSVLWDRSLFSTINVVNGDSIQFTYELTCNAGG